ncbi:MAG TPA: adenosine deaminase [Ignavibacteriaceae bacterium]|nr:adenosine deaminase [Ignavibacteriaceae bacterium]
MTTEEIIRSVPKVLLHDHLDGGLRPQTIIDLAKEIKYNSLPTNNPTELAEWFHRGANKGNLVEYLQGFEHTCAVMQTKEALSRVAYEMMEDMKKDGVCYVETRFAPVFHTSKGLYMDDVVNAVLEGLEKGKKDGVCYVETRFAPVFHTSKGLYMDDVVNAVLEGLEKGKKDFGVGYGLILCGMRNMQNTLEIAELAVNFRNHGVVGFDLAGEEGGYPPKRHIEAFQFIQRANFNITIHAGEAFGKESIWQAIQWCGAHRIGHGTRILEDLVRDKDGNVVALGELSQYILDQRIPIEICLLSNVHTGAIDKLENHPFQQLYKLKFRLTINTDDRLMSDTTMTNEFMLAQKYFNLNLDDIEKLTINGMKSAFINYHDRLHYIYNVIKPGYQKIREQLLSLK